MEIMNEFQGYFCDSGLLRLGLSSFIFLMVCLIAVESRDLKGYCLDQYFLKMGNLNYSGLLSHG